ncbi:hypothetical protein CEXT_531601 [Caerostris extrusa]|uniref:Uncharacterized protein n=1 Tax=Caerostris extrusa TaxID=172846 RepID=A0AAV4NG60_CAEEX|nr:hypothetical protein CEXT_531601 [Caerostris extrusa]
MHELRNNGQRRRNFQTNSTLLIYLSQEVLRLAMRTGIVKSSKHWLSNFLTKWSMECSHLQHCPPAIGTHQYPETHPG